MSPEETFLPVIFRHKVHLAGNQGHCVWSGFPIFPSGTGNFPIPNELKDSSAEVFGKLLILVCNDVKIVRRCSEKRH